MRFKSILRERKLSMVFSILFAALVFTFTVQTIAADDNRISEKNYSNFEKLQQIASSEGKVRVILKLEVPKIKELTAESTSFCTLEPGLKSSWGGANADMALMDAIASAAYDILANLSGTDFHENHIYTTIPYMALEVSAEALVILNDLPQVLDIEEDKLMKLIAPVPGSIGAKGKTNNSGTSDLSRTMLDNTVSVIGADKAWAMGFTGSGWYVAILDTGIRRTHKFFQGKTIVEACFSLGETGSGDCPNGNKTMTGTGAAAHHPSTYDGYDHGTHVAGIAAGNNGTLFGVAKDANIIAVQVFSRFSADEPSCGGSPCVLCWHSDTIAGLDYIYQIRGKYSIAAVNMSLGGGKYSSYCDSDSRKAAIDNLKAAGIATVIATGNDEYCGYVGSPACISSAVSVGSSTDDDRESYFNNWDETLQELFAPGSGVYSSTGASNSSYESWSGTSMATPHVSGAWALLKQAKPSGTVSKFLSVLQSTGTPITSVCDGYTKSIPRIQIDEAIGEQVEIVTVTSPNGGENWTAGTSEKITWTSVGNVGNVKIEYSTNNGSSWSTVVSSTANDGTYSWTIPNVTSSQCLVRVSKAASGTPADTSNAVFSISSTPPSIALNRTILYFTAIVSGLKTGNQEIWIKNNGGGTLNWTASSNASWLTCTPASGTNAGIVTVGVNPTGLAVGSYIGIITFSAAGTAYAQVVTVYLNVKNTSQTQSPFGEFATPTHGSTVMSSIPVTGWVLDDVEVKGVKIYNGSSFVGDAGFVEGARPDVEQAYPGYPKNYQAGWGYMMLTNFLPNGGNGTYTIYAKATDAEGHTVTLGSKTITCDNAHAVKPFGAIDTPTQGGTASGSSFINWGWVLTPQPNSIPTNGSTLNVYVDGVNLGHPSYNNYRADIASFFPGYANSNGAAGFFYLDTTAYENGIHTIQWTATDSGGNTDGIGSRYFSISNTGTSASSTKSYQVKTSPQTPTLNISKLADIPVDYSVPVRVKRGFKEDIEPQVVLADETGMNRINIKEVERVQIYLTDRCDEDETAESLNSNSFTGYLEVNSRLEPLPVGSTLDTKWGIFYWQPGPGFIGEYRFVFIEKEQNTDINRKNIIVKIVPGFE